MTKFDTGNMGSEKVYAAVDIGGTKTAVVLSSQPPNILERNEFPTLPIDGPDPALKQIIDSLWRQLSSRQLVPSALQAIGVSCGGPLDPVAGIIQAPPNLSTWRDVGIKSILEKEFGVQCLVENDANAGALAEFWFGAGQGVNSIVFLTMGTGLGAGLILDGRLYRGASNLAGEIGHIRLTSNGPCAYGKVGSAEGWASGAGMAESGRAAVRLALRQGEATLLGGFDLDSLTAQDVWETALTGDAVAQRVVQITGERLGEVAALLVDLLNPDCIVVGGLAVYMGDALLGPARRVMGREALRGAAEVCQIVPAALGRKIGDVAALCVALNLGNGLNTRKLQGSLTQ